MTLLIFFLITIIITFFLINALVLFGLTKLFKIQNATYKNSIKILLFFSIIIILVGQIFIVFKSLIGLDFLFILFEILITFFVFYYFFKKYYQSNLKKSLGIYLSFLVISLVSTLIIVMPIRAHIAEPFVVIGESMNPTYNNVDYLLIDKLSNKFDRSDIIVAHNPKEQNQFMIKRIIGLPNEKVEIKNGDIFINGKILSEDYIINKTNENIAGTLDSNQYFVLSDNRDEDLNSRSFDPISENDIEGKVFYKISSLVK